MKIQTALSESKTGYAVCRSYPSEIRVIKADDTQGTRIKGGKHTTVSGQEFEEWTESFGWEPVNNLTEII